jgi:hypothetical protein
MDQDKRDASKNVSGKSPKAGGSTGNRSDQRPTSDQGQGGNWPSKSQGKSGPGRGNAPPSK